MSVRLPIVHARAPGAQAAAVTALPRAAVTRPLLCITGSGTSTDASLRFAGALVAALVQRGRAVAVLVAHANRPSAQGAPRSDLHALGARIVELPDAQLPGAALDALDALAPEAIAIGLGAELSASLQGLLTIRVGRDAAVSSRFPVDLELPADAEAVASEIGAWLAQR